MWREAYPIAGLAQGLSSLSSREAHVSYLPDDLLIGVVGLLARGFGHRRCSSWPAGCLGQDGQNSAGEVWHLVDNLGLLP